MLSTRSASWPSRNRRAKRDRIEINPPAGHLSGALAVRVGPGARISDFFGGNG